MGTAADLATDGTTDETANEHHKPIHGNDKSNSGSCHALFGGKILKDIGRSTHFNAHIEEYTKHTEYKMTVLDSTLNETHINGGLLRFFYLGEKNNNKCDDKDGKSNHQSRSGICNLGFFGNFTDKGTHKDIYGNCCRAVENATNLDKLITLVSTTTEEVEHGVYHTVQNTHAETGNECTGKVNAKDKTEIFLCVELAAEPLDANAYNADSKTDKSSLLVAELGNKHTGRNTHKEISNEVSVVTDLGEDIGYFALILNNGCHR